MVQKDMSRLKELTDDELVAACGGRTAHKGSRHGLKMTAKLDRIAEAEREYMEKYNKKIKETKGKVEEKTTGQSEGNFIDQSEESSSSKEKKKKKKKRSLEDEVEEAPRKKKKLKKEVETESLSTEPRKKKHKELERSSVEVSTEVSKKKKKRKKEEAL